MSEAKFYGLVPGAKHVTVFVSDENRMVLHGVIGKDEDAVSASIHLSLAQARALAATLVKAADAAEAVAP